jgi:hypothetical protein
MGVLPEKQTTHTLRPGPIMKRFRILPLLAGLLFLAAGCDEGPTAAEREGRLDALLDGQAWVGTATSDILGDDIYITSRRTNVQREQSLTVRVAETSPGVYAIVPGAAGNGSSYWETVGGDVVEYRADVTAGTIDIDHIDRITGEIRGTLSLTIQGTRGTSVLEQGQLMAVGWREPTER